MKKIIIIIILSLIGVFAHAQGIVYTPFIPGQSQSNTQQRSQSVISTTAYSFDMYGNIIKTRIQVKEVSSRTLSGPQLYVVALYDRTGGILNQWREIHPILVRKCISVGKPYSRDGEMEARFMYKATLYGTTTYYFDL